MKAVLQNHRQMQHLRLKEQQPHHKNKRKVKTRQKENQLLNVKINTVIRLKVMRLKVNGLKRRKEYEIHRMIAIKLLNHYWQEALI